ncbi:hypothetical protein [Novosphingobium pentaromativorans]|uniref:Uncharacterized protein n=1 Tax=Novosphingobium pentaromativorans US6-1 TaxID=1088721 RepID=G6E7M1_9SPHN|nr:hypothetical protein [Novosphingobium pentaromativorans]EHJ62844.1 hypothetical protein NSU_0356 [Novosphingobium pentaromativorans US6-1]
MDKPDLDDVIEEIKHPSETEMDIGRDQSSREIRLGMTLVLIVVAVVVLIATALRW